MLVCQCHGTVTQCDSDHVKRPSLYCGRWTRNFGKRGWQWNRCLSAFIQLESWTLENDVEILTWKFSHDVKIEQTTAMAWHRLVCARLASATESLLPASAAASVLLIRGMIIMAS